MHDFKCDDSAVGKQRLESINRLVDVINGLELTYRSRVICSEYAMAYPRFPLRTLAAVRVFRAFGWPVIPPTYLLKVQKV